MTEDIFSQPAGGTCREQCRGLIISPGALGDNILMLPLANFMKENLRLDRVDFIGHKDYIQYMPGRSSVDAFRSIDMIDFHRFFMDDNEFVLNDKDLLIHAFSNYQWIACFLGCGNNDFESNFLFTINCSHSAEVIFMQLMPRAGSAIHISEFYLNQFNRAAVHLPDSIEFDVRQKWVHATERDTVNGRSMLSLKGMDVSMPLVSIHPGSGSSEKCWSFENFVCLADKLKSQGYQVLFILGPKEIESYGENELKRMCSKGAVISGISVSQVCQILSCSVGFIGNDSGVGHLAGAMGIKTVSLFGPTDPQVYHPLGPNVHVCQQDSEDFNHPSDKSVSEVLDILLCKL